MSNYLQHAPSPELGRDTVTLKTTQGQW